MTDLCFYQCFLLLFTDTKVYSALGNHDYHPKSQLPPEQNNIYEQIQKLWEDWLDPATRNTFKKGKSDADHSIDQQQLKTFCH